MEAPFFSIIIPTYNRSKIMVKSISSVFSQDFSDFELIIVDDGSTDDTEEIMKEYLIDSRVSYLKQMNKGVSAARNAGALKANGKYLIFLDSDDWLSEQYLEKCFYLLSTGSFKLLLGGARYYLPDGSISVSVMPEESGQYFTHGLAGSFAISSTLCRSMGGYDENLSYSENSDLFLRIFDGSTLRKDEVAISKEIYVGIPKEDTQVRKARHAAKRYDNATYFLDKHVTYFKSSLSSYANHKKIQALSALQLGRVKEARKCLLDLMKRKPFMPSAMLMFLFILILPGRATKHYS